MGSFLASLGLTRDSVLLWWGKLAGLVLAAAGMLSQGGAIPAIPTYCTPYILLAAFVIGGGSAHYATSPLPGRYDAPGGVGKVGGGSATIPRTLSIILLALVLGAAAVGASACASTLTPEENIASLSTRVVGTFTAVLTAIQQAHAATPSLVTEAMVDQVAVAGNALGRDAEALAAELQQYDALQAAAGNTATIVGAIQSTIADLNAQLATVGRAVPHGTVGAIDAAVAQAIGLVSQIQAGVL